jgi:hypothetical protein
MMICSIDECGQEVVAKCLCNRHYKRLKRHGHPMGGRTDQGAPLKFLTGLVGFEGSECVTWPFGERANGYGLITYRGVNMNASRAICILAHGEPRAGLVAAHSCGKGHLGCVNPNHIRWATIAENNQDTLSHGTKPIGEAFAGAVLTEKQVKEIRALKGKMKQREIGERFGVGQSYVSLIHLRKIWKHVA